ncbi:zinc finger BED domain-containing protein RICESLEEPER 2-like [Amaranthus tricolor]|uniref:zinc finger BED domain-containing protein RICESLEEPER 2-like n=1 Tax=Amaranthus tricolor TaxID=29722 RepID=UPI0025911F91|nr:zinc finger BED domain-containing protein RICESLEEPER 2-like [Amaranthus tricolor]
MLGGDFLHMRCSAYILNLIVRDGLDIIDSAICKVRDCVAFWMSTPKRIEKFEEACRLLNVTKPKRVSLDCKTRWNFAYDLLDTCLPFKEVFNKLKRLHRRLNFDVPSDHDWQMATLVCQKLEIFYKATKVFFGRNHPTSNLYFRNVCEIKLALTKWRQNDNIEIIRKMAEKMVEKFDKYWDHTNELLAIAGILDPRNKMDLETQFEDLGDEDDFAKTKRQKIDYVPSKSEIDQYLESRTLPENNEFNILAWWKIDQSYPTLRKIAKDILAIPVLSVASESAFSTGGRVVSAHRSRLHSQTVEALMCLQNWMVDDAKVNFQGTYACSTINEDGEDVEIMDNLDMDIDDVSVEEF